jgi:hypothetical protein
VVTFGAGNNLNRYFLDESAKVGNGYSTEITENESVGPLVGAAWTKIESPQLRDIAITCGDLNAEQLLMPAGTMLYKGSPVTICGVYTKGGMHTVKITGKRDTGTVTISKDVELAAGPSANAMIPQVWARQMIAKLRLEEGTTAANKAKIIEISKAYQVLSDYTAFLAINPVAANEDNSIQKYTDALNRAEADVLSTMALFVKHHQLAVEMPAGVFIKEIALYDLFGRCVYRFRMSSPTCNRFVWDGMLGAGIRLPKGNFVVRITTTKGLFTRAMMWR